jgi:hypothetical protein
MTRNELYELLKKCGWETTPIHTLDKIWGQPFEGETEKIKPDAEKSSSTAERKLELAYMAIRTALEQFERVNWGWDGDCGSKNIIACLEEFLPTPTPTQPQ